MAPIIRTEKLRKVYAVGKERVVALNNVDLSIEKGEFCCIVGQSGSGKSTLLNQLAGLGKADVRQGIHRKARDQQNDRERVGRVPPAAPGVHFSELQPAAHHDGGGERRPAADVQGCGQKDPSGPRPQRAEIHGSAGPRQPPAHRDERRPAAARRHCPRVRQQSQGHFCR